MVGFPKKFESDTSIPVHLLKPTIKDDGKNLIDVSLHASLSQAEMQKMRKKKAEAELENAGLVPQK